MASAFPYRSGARRDSATAAPQEPAFPYGALPAKSSSTLRWATGKEELASLITQEAHAFYRQKRDYHCTSARDTVPHHMAHHHHHHHHHHHQSRLHSTFRHGCVVRRPSTTYSKQIPPILGVHRATHVPAGPPPDVSTSAAVLQPPAISAPLQQQQQPLLRRPQLQLPASLPNGIPLRRTVNSCFEHYKILESVGSGTYANVWKVQKLPGPRLYNGMPLTPPESLSHPKAAAVTAHLCKSPLQRNTCTDKLSEERERRTAVSNILQWQMTPHPSAAYLPKGCQQQSGHFRRNSCCSVNGVGISSGAALIFEGRQSYDRRYPVDSQIYAAKLLQVDRFSSDTLPRVLDMFSKEIVNLALCQCPGVVRLHEVVEGKEGWLLVQDYIDGGTIWCEDVCRDEDEAFLHFIQLVQAVLYLQENNILHRDLKPTNILRSTQSRRVVIADFGWSERLDCCHITPMEWPGTLEINPPEIINGTGPMTDRLDNYAVGMTLLLFLSSRFVCRQKGLDAATAAPHVLRTVDELRRGSPPAVFKGSADAWTLFLGLTAPHPSHRWSLDHALSHSWVQQKLMQLGEKAFIWHPRVLQLTAGLQCAYRKSLHFVDSARLSGISPRQQGGVSGRCNTTTTTTSTTTVVPVSPSSTCKFESSVVVQVIPGSDATRSEVLWVPDRYPTVGGVSSGCATTYTLQGAKKISTAVAAEWTATTTVASAVHGVRNPSSHNNSSSRRDAHYDQRCDGMSGVVSRERLAAACSREQQLQITHVAQALQGTSYMRNISASSQNAKPTHLPFVPHQVHSKGLHAEQGSTCCSRRQSMSICSTTDSFMTNLSFQQQQASQQSLRGHLRAQTASSPLTPKSYVEKRCSAEGTEWQAPVLPFTVNTNTGGSLDDGTLSQDDDGRTSVLQTRITHANNSEVYLSDNLPGYQQRYQLNEMAEIALENGLNHQLHYACEEEATDKQRETSNVATDVMHVPYTTVSSSGSLLPRYNNTSISQFLSVNEGRQIGSITTVPQHRPLPRQMLPPGFVAEAGVDFYHETHKSAATVTGTEHSMPSVALRGAIISKKCTGTQCSSQESQKAEAAARTFDTWDNRAVVDRRHEEFTNPLPVPATQLIDLNTSDKTWMQTGPSGKADSVESNSCTQQQGWRGGVYDRSGTVQCTTFTLPGRTSLEVLDETVVEDDGTGDVDSRRAVLHTRKLSLHTEGAAAAEDDITVGRIKVLQSGESAAQYGRAATAPPLRSACTTLHPSVEREPLQWNPERHTWWHHHGATSLCKPHVINNVDNGFGNSKHNISTSTLSTCDRTVPHGHVSTFATVCPARDGDTTFTRAAADLDKLQCEEQHLPVCASASKAARQIPLQQCSKAPLSIAAGPSQRYCVSPSVAATHRSSAGSSSPDRGLGTPVTLGPSCNGELASTAISKGKGVYAAQHDFPPELPHSGEDTGNLARDEETKRHDRPTAFSARQRPDHIDSALEFDAPTLTRSYAMRRLPSQHLSPPLGLEIGCEPTEMPTSGKAAYEGATKGILRCGSSSKLRHFPPERQLLPSTTVGVDMTEKSGVLSRGSLSSPGAATLAVDPSTDDQRVDATSAAVKVDQSDFDITTEGTQRRRTSLALNTTLSREPAPASLSNGWWTIFSREAPDSRRSSDALYRAKENAPSLKNQFLNLPTSSTVPAPASESSRLPVDPSLGHGAERLRSHPNVDPNDKPGEDKHDNRSTLLLKEYKGRNLQEQEDYSVLPDNDGMLEERARNSEIRPQRHSPKRYSLFDANVNQNSHDLLDENYQAKAFRNSQERLSSTAHAVSCSGETHVKESSLKAEPLDAGEGSATAALVGEEASTKPREAVNSSASQEFVPSTVESPHIAPAANNKLNTATSELPSIAVYARRFADSSVENRKQPESCASWIGSSGLASGERAEGARTFRCSRPGSQPTMQITGSLRFHERPQSPPSTFVSSTVSSCENTEGMDERQEHVLLPHALIHPYNSKLEQRQRLFCSEKSILESFEEGIVEDTLTGETVSEKDPGMCQYGNIAYSKRSSAQETCSSTSKSCSKGEYTLVGEYLKNHHDTREENGANKRESSAASTQTSVSTAAEVKGVGIRDEAEKPVICSQRTATEKKAHDGEESLMYLNTCPEFSGSQENTDMDSKTSQLQYVDCAKQSTRESDFLYLTPPAEEGDKDEQKTCYTEGILTVTGQRAASFPMTTSTSCTRRIHDGNVQAETTFLCGKQQPRRSSLTPLPVSGDKRCASNSAATPILKFNSEPVSPTCLN